MSVSGRLRITVLGLFLAQGPYKSSHPLVAPQEGESKAPEDVPGSELGFRSGSAAEKLEGDDPEVTDVSIGQGSQPSPQEVPRKLDVSSEDEELLDKKKSIVKKAHARASAKAAATSKKTKEDKPEEEMVQWTE